MATLTWDSIGGTVPMTLEFYAPDGTTLLESAASTTGDESVAADGEVRVRILGGLPSMEYSLIVSAGLSRVEETEAAFDFSSGWSAWLSGVHSGGSARFTRSVGSSVDVTFTGPEVALWSHVGPDRGIAEVLVDGVSFGQVDLYRSAWRAQERVFTAAGLGAGQHVLTVRYVGANPAAMSNPAVVIDAIEAAGT